MSVMRDSLGFTSQWLTNICRSQQGIGNGRWRRRRLSGGSTLVKVTPHLQTRSSTVLIGLVGAEDCLDEIVRI